MYEPMLPVKDSEFLLNHFFNATSDFMCVLDQDGSVLKINSAFLSLLGTIEKNVLGKNLLDFIHPEDQAISKEVFYMFLEGNYRGRFENRYILSDGRIKHLQWTSAVLVEEKFVVTIARDVTYDRKKELEMMEAELRLNHFIDLLPHSVFIKDHNFKYLLVNNAQEQLFECDREQMIGLDDTFFIKEEKELETIYKSDVQVLAQKKEVILPEQQYTDSKGTQKTLYTSKIPFKSMVTGETNILGISIDLTELKKTEEELKHSNYELDKFVYHASHDLRAPLCSLLGLIRIMERDSSQETKEICLSKAKASIHKLDRLILDLTSISRNKRLEVEQEEINFSNLIQECINDLRFMENLDKILVKYSLRENLKIIGDYERVKIIFSNIISNAILYQDSQKEAYLDIQVNTEQEDSLTIIFEDNGIGIEPEYQSRIFDMFFRATEFSSGSGLGLYIVKQCIDKLNGQIELSSKVGEGTRFKIILPIN